MDKDFRLAIIVNPGLELGVIANTVGAISIGLGAGLPELAGRKLTDRLDRTINISSSLPVPILQADEDVIQAIMLKAFAQIGGRVIVPFPAFARALHAYEDYEDAFPHRDLAEERIDGLGLAGALKWIKSLTGSLKLLR